MKEGSVKTVVLNLAELKGTKNDCKQHEFLSSTNLVLECTMKYSMGVYTVDHTSCIVFL